MASLKPTGPIEAKAVAAPSTTLIAGYIVWAVVTFWPAAAKAIPQSDQIQLTVVIAWLFSSLAAYFAPHTNKPALMPAVPDTSTVGSTATGATGVTHP